MAKRKIKKIKSIYMIFVLFFVMTGTCFAILYGYSRISLQDSLQSVARVQMKYARTLLEQKCREIEIEADGILNSDNMRAMQATMEASYDAYNYVTNARAISDYLEQRQKSNIGMAEFILYWPSEQRILSTSFVAGVDQELMDMAEDAKWLCYEGNIYYVRRYGITRQEEEQIPYLFVKLEKDYLYRIKSMASGMEYGGTLLLMENGESFFPTNAVEGELLEQMKNQTEPAESLCCKTSGGKYQLISSEPVANGLRMVSYYTFREMMRPVRNISSITAVTLLVFLLVGFSYMALYYKEILMQLKMLTDKLMQVEEGDFSTRIQETPGNEFSYVFTQFNHMTMRIGQLMETTLNEQRLRNQAELRQLQMQIQPHFLYNSLSYIVTVADQPRAVTEMAMHLSDYYRHCTTSKELTTIGDEVSYARAYLSIMALRKNIEYDISAESGLLQERIIPLLLQPLIENAIEHAIEERENARHIYVKIYRLPLGPIQFEVSDDGNGMTEEEIQSLRARLNEKKQEGNKSIGLWNVNQRLVNYYDKTAGLQFHKSIWGGLMVAFAIVPKG